jgi:hypothetical protein
MERYTFWLRLCRIVLPRSRNRRIRAPYVRWCGRGERATAPPIPIYLTPFPSAAVWIGRE